jgi:hypothetical protein
VLRGGALKIGVVPTIGCPCQWSPKAIGAA